MHNIHAEKKVARASSLRQVQRGVTSIEYGLLATLLAIAAIGGFTALGGSNGANWTNWVALFIAAIGG
jgi:Flp pilus assembly pilin Flp